MARPKTKYQDLVKQVSKENRKIKNIEEIKQIQNDKEEILTKAIVYYIFTGNVNIEKLCNELRIPESTFKSRLYRLTKSKVKKLAIEYGYEFTEMQDSNLNEEQLEFLRKKYLSLSLDYHWEKRLKELKKLEFKHKEEKN